MNPPFSFETDRLLLKKPEEAMASSIIKNYSSDAEVAKYLTWKPHSTIQETKDFIRICRESWDRRASFTWAITLKSSSETIGMLAARNNQHKTDIGYVLGRSFWGQGLMTEACFPFIQWALKEPSLFRIWGFCDVENLASARVMEKLGMKREALLKRWIVHPNFSLEPRDCYSFALCK